MAAARTIIHLDLDAFFCAVEEQRNPSLCGKAFAVGGRPESRGVVSSASYTARQFGVRSAMPMAQAVRLCPELVVVPPNSTAYRAASQQVMQGLGRMSNLFRSQEDQHIIPRVRYGLRLHKTWERRQPFDAYPVPRLPDQLMVCPILPDRSECDEPARESAHDGVVCR